MRLCSTNSFERRNKEIKRRIDVVGVFPEKSLGYPLGRCSPDGDLR
jgi:hypothetical protein